VWKLHSADDTADLHRRTGLKSNVRYRKPFRESALIQYEKTIQTAFTEFRMRGVPSAVGKAACRQELLVAALADRTRLAYVRYRGGVTRCLNALDSDRDLFQSELATLRNQMEELVSVVQLYKALGGGWQ